VRLAQTLLCRAAMQKLLWVSLVMVAACGRGFESDPPKQREPLNSCDGLDRAACGARSDCVGEELACIALCADDGHGGCLPCESFRCVLRRPPACATLDVNACTTRADCRLSSNVSSSPTPASGADQAPPCDPTAGFAACERPDTTVHCVDALPPACGQLDANACTARPDCRLETAVADCAPCAPGSFGCTDCGASETRCVEATPPACSALDENACSARPDCRLEVSVSDCAPCAPGSTGCSDCGASAARCVDATVVSCETLDLTTCGATPGCHVENLVCDAACRIDEHGNTVCPPCAAPRCVADQPVASCFGLDEATCSTRTDCSYQAMACPAVCLDDGHGGCLPCPMEYECVPSAPPSPCLGLDLATCSTDSRCEVVAYACTTECRDDGDGGCLPCDAPPPSCQPRAEEPIAGCGRGGP